MWVFPSPLIHQVPSLPQTRRTKSVWNNRQTEGVPGEHTSVRRNFRYSVDTPPSDSAAGGGEDDGEDDGEDTDELADVAPLALRGFLDGPEASPSPLTEAADRFGRTGPGSTAAAGKSVLSAAMRTESWSTSCHISPRGSSRKPSVVQRDTSDSKPVMFLTALASPSSAPAPAVQMFSRNDAGL